MSRESKNRRPWFDGVPIAPIPPPPIHPEGIPSFDPSLAEGLEGTRGPAVMGALAPTLVLPLTSDDPSIKGRSLVAAPGGWTLRYEKPWWKIAIDVGRATGATV
jgi:hypothetical protein